MDGCNVENGDYCCEINSTDSEEENKHDPKALATQTM